MNENIDDSKAIRKFEMLVKEISSVGRLEEYPETVRTILKDIINKGCRVSVQDIPGYKGSSYCEGLIRLSLKKKPLDGIWDLLHEFGHFLSGELTNEERINYDKMRMKREILAWEYADIEITKYSELMKKSDEYKSYKETCLNHYRSQELTD